MYSSKTIAISVWVSLLLAMVTPGCSPHPDNLPNPDAPQTEPDLSPKTDARTIDVDSDLHSLPTLLGNTRLDELGIRFDCYFTCEELFEKFGQASRIWYAHLAKGFQPTSREEMIAGLAQSLPGFMVVADKTSPAVIRIRDARLLNRADYGIDRTRKITFSGPPTELLDWLDKNQADVALSRGGAFRERVFDGRSPLRIRSHDGSIRRLLTAYLPLSDYNRVLWVADSSVENGKLKTEVSFRGMRTGIVPSKKITGFPNATGFASGEVAYYVNAGEQDQIPAAIRFIEEHMQPGASSLQVRWAMLFLGREKAQSGIPVLLRHIDHLYTPWGVVREAYPAVKALAQVGPEGANACLDRLPAEDHPLRQRLLCQVLLDHHGDEKALQALRDQAAKFTDAPVRNRLAGAEAILRDLSKE